MKNERGVMLLMVVVGLIGLAGGLFMVSRAFSAQANEVRTVDENAYRAVLRQWIRAGMDCPKSMTLNAGTCGTGTVAIGRKGASATPLIVSASPFTKVGNFEVKATCSGSAPKTFRFEAQLGGQGRWFPVFPTNPPSCP